MKRLLFAMGAIILLNGCDGPEVTTDIVGEWTLIEVLADPGDGSGRFRSVSSDKQITFFEDGIYTSRGSICDFSIESEGTITGTYALSDSGYWIDCADSVDYSIGLRLEGGFLIITFPCFEPCLQKFRKRN
ncbi:hypothetical protein [Lentiprolixibacter aurantiacus]|uniref:Lipocalin-like domain-containing protein n=1 Tax=Lentiprolixibacter aurantiacus TaxID=2993939 RepID=A0AAE3SPE7_9FLAO|nr:hypothetical protein [Lentiprolixibacter aurantiacus]MCX2720732.1 hypothetical protein [Lentiprolixibacter aurantiacus]